MNAFTPGPWGISLFETTSSFDGGRMEICDVMGADGIRVVANIPAYKHRFTRDTCCEANARLIAASPKMLAALDSALAALDAIGQEMTVGERYTNAGQYLLDALPIVRAAIAEAKGIKVEGTA